MSVPQYEGTRVSASADSADLTRIILMRHARMRALVRRTGVDFSKSQFSNTRRLSKIACTLFLVAFVATDSIFDVVLSDLIVEYYFLIIWYFFLFF